MNRITLAAAAIFIGLVANATPPSGTNTKPAFNKTNRIIGSPSLSGLGRQSPIQQSFAPKAALTSQPVNASYDPRTISDVKYDAGQSTPIFFKSTKTFSSESLNTAASIQTAAASFLESYKQLIHINSPSNEFVLKSYEKDYLGFTHVKMTQTFGGATVWGKEIYLHFSANGATVNGRWSSTPLLSALTSSISAEDAAAVVTSDAKPAAMNEAAKQLLKYNGPVSQLVVLTKNAYNSADRWSYRVEIRTDFVNMYEYFVDAITGQIISKSNISCTTGPTTSTITDLNGHSQNINTYQNGSSYYMIDITRSMFNSGASSLPNSPVGALWTVDANYSDASNIQVQQVTTTNNNSWPNSATAASASVNGATAYNFYHNVHGRNSIDGNGGTIISVINVNDNGQPMDNAFWNGQLMAYGNGNTYFRPLAGGLDVAGHEMTHGVIQATANLQYQDQSGALNESMADVFGVLISGSNYTIGSTVTLTSFISTGNLRDLSYPHNGTTQGNPGWQPAIMSEYVTGTADNGGVHTNSGIPNHAFYYFATWVGRSTADSIYYRALTKYLVTGSQFIDARVAVINAASDLYGASSSVVHYAGLAFDSVGIIGSVPTIALDTASVNGPDWIVYQDTVTTAANSLYMIPANTTLTSLDYHPLHTNPALNRVSVTDDGSIIYFVDVNHNVYSVTANITSPVQTELINSGEWDFVSVSRDGKKLALISKYQDTAIYVYNFALSAFKKYHLYAPTFSAGITTNGPVFAGSVDWDPTSQYLIYDENNVINSTDGSIINYWDIGLMKVWDNTNDYFDSGQVSKLVNSLPDGISIGNPVYSKNHTSIVAFDLLTDSTGAFDAKGADLSTGAIGTILLGNSVANIPSFSGADDKITYTSQDGSSNMVIGTVTLAPDLINGNAAPATLVTNAEQSVWFRIGQRPSAISDINSTDQIKLYPVPTSDRLVLDLQDQSTYTNIQISDIMGRVVLSQSVSSKLEQINVSALQAGVYIIRLKDDSGVHIYTSRILKN